MLSCLDEAGNAVDSWVALPENADYNYYWHDSNLGFIKSGYNLNQTLEGNIMATVNQLYDPLLNLDNIAYALYNDDPPPPEDTASSTYAHAKGVLMTNDEQGFWLIHSKPNWPAARTTGAIPFPDTQYAQSLMCITLNTASFNSIAATNMVNYPYLYDSYISSSLEAVLPEFSEWIGGAKSTIINTTNTIVSAGGVSYTQFAKSKAWGKDLYEDFVAPTLDRSLNVETWRLGSGGRMSSFCDSGVDDTWNVHPTVYDVIEVSQVTMPDGASWTGTQDHSKWVSTIADPNNTQTYVCVGDINRMCSQENRGGGTVCVSNASATLWQSFEDAITDVEECWEYNPCDGSSSKCYWCPMPDPSLVPSPFPTPNSYTATPTDSSYPVIVGDLAIILFNSDNPDVFSVVALYTISAGTELKFTDDGWTGTEFRGGEGVLSFTTTAAIPAGYVWTYEGVGTPDPYGSWASVSGSFSLSTTSDQVFVYVGEEANPTFVFGLSTNPWVTDGTDVGTTDSVCPSSLIDIASVSFDTVDNGAYNGLKSGTKDDLLAAICNNSAWITSSISTFDPNNAAFTVVSSTDTDAPTPADSSSGGSSTPYGSLTEYEFIAALVGVGVLMFAIIAFALWKYLSASRGKEGPLADEDGGGRDSTVEISDHSPGDLITAQA